MGIRDNIRMARARSKAKSDLKRNLKDRQWAADYNNELQKLLGTEQSTQKKTKTSAYYPYNGYYTGSDSGGAKYPYGLSGDGRTRHMDHFRMRQNARDAFHDSMDARSIVERFSDSIVDTGLVLESTPNYEILGITPEQAETWSSNVNRRFHLFCMDKKQHLAQNMNLYQFQRLYEIHQQRDNDIFVRFKYSGSRKLQSPLQLEMIDANQIRGHAWTSTWAQTSIEDGIIRNADGSEKAYKIWFINPAKENGYDYATIPRIGEKSGRVMMLHGFNPEYAGQLRGYSRIGFAIQELQNITDLTLAQIKKAINQSNLVMAVENEMQDASNPMEDLARQPAIGTISQAAQEVVDELSADPITVCPLPEAGLDTPGSTALFNLQQGDKLKMIENTTPAESFKDFIMVFSERLAAAAGIPIEVVLMKFGQNYSASRATLVLFWRVVQMWRNELAADFLNPLYESWLCEEIAAGRISAPGWSDPILRAAWLTCNWIGASLPSIDPAKDAKAMKDNLEMNLTTLERESRNLNGSNAKDNISKNAKLFPSIVPVPWGKSATPQPAESDNSDMEDTDAER